MSTRSIVTTSAAALLLTGAVAAVAAPAQALPGGWWSGKTFVCSSVDHAGQPLPDVTVKASNEVGAAYFALQELGPLGPHSAHMQCRQQ
ncbi:hypothetical protein [Nocardia sp. NPDC058666]|uniref:hypothetical protein n=1 Tax=unclassified Nocardia TaxID=2637762 RepID=UPI00366287F9